MSANYTEQRSANSGPEAQPTTDFCTAHELKRFLYFLNG